MNKRPEIIRHALLFGVALSLVAISPARVSAQEEASRGPEFELEVIIASLTNETNKIDKAAKRLHKELRNQFRYEGIRVLETVDLRVSGDDVWDLKLPSRRRLRMRPLVVEKDSALISVEVSGLVQSDLKIKRGQLVIIGAERFRDGKLVIAIEAAK